MKLLLLLLFVSLRLHAEVVRIPVVLEGTKEDNPHRVGDNYVYNVKGVLKPVTIVVKKYDRPASIEQLISTLIFSYKNGDRTLFKSLFSSSAIPTLDKIPADVFNDRFEALKSVEKPVLDFYFEQDNGFLGKLEYTSAGIKKFELLFMVKEGDVFKLGSLAVKSEDLRYHNLSHFLTYSQFEYGRPAILKLPDPKDLNFVAKNRFPFISFLKKEDGKWVKKGFVKSNAVGKYLLDDLDPREDHVKVLFEEGNFAKNLKHEILVIESTFPLTHLPLSFAEKGQIELILPETGKGP